jgi:hypothetical protein
MNTHADKTQENKGQSVANAVSQSESSSESIFQFVDNRPEAIQMRKLQEMANNSPQAKQAAQLQAMADNYSAKQLQTMQLKSFQDLAINSTQTKQVIQRVGTDSEDESSDGTTDEESSWFKYSRRKKKITPRPGERATNQSSKRVVKKTAKKIKDEVPPAKRRKTTKTFLQDHSKNKGLSEMDSGNGLDMSHAVSAQRLGAGLAKASSVRTKKQAKRHIKALKEQIDGHLSSDADSEDFDEMHDHADAALDISKDPEERMEALDEILKRENRVSSNLAGGASSTNRGIGGKDDPASMTDGTTFPHFERRFKNQATFEEEIGLDGSRFAAKKDKSGKVISSSHGRKTATAAAATDYEDPDSY